MKWYRTFYPDPTLYPYGDNCLALGRALLSDSFDDPIDEGVVMFTCGRPRSSAMEAVANFMETLDQAVGVRRTVEMAASCRSDYRSFREAMMARYFHEGERAKQLLREAGFGVTGTSLLESVKEVLEAWEGVRHGQEDP